MRIPQLLASTILVPNHRSLFKLIFFVILHLFYSNTYSQQTDTLTNEKVIKLYKAGFGKDVLKSKIQTSITNFDVSIDGLINLKKANLPEEVINLMIAKPKHSNTQPGNNDINSNGQQSNSALVGLSLESGIYYRKPSEDFVEIEPSILTNTKTDRGAQILISPLINAKTKASLSGKESSSQIYESKPKFYFVFDTTFKNNLNSENNTWFGSTRSPKEFLLVKLIVNKNSREITIGKGNVVNQDFGIDEKSIIHFTSKKISKGVYEVSPDLDFTPGEYCFIFAQGIKQGQSSKVFDFAIKNPKGF
jgi:hypothetical protein